MLELVGSTAIERSPPSRSWPIEPFHLMKRPVTTRLPALRPGRSAS